jgi:hypothetical protein
MRRLAFGLVFLCQATIAHAADGAGQDSNSSPWVWILVFLPAFLIVLFLVLISRKTRELSMKSIREANEYRIMSEAHMRRLEAQIENLDKRLIRMIELLEAIEQGPKRDHN